MRAPFFCPYTTRSSLLPLFCRKSQQLFSTKGSLRQRALLLSDKLLKFHKIFGGFKNIPYLCTRLIYLLNLRLTIRLAPPPVKDGAPFFYTLLRHDLTSLPYSVANHSPCRNNSDKNLAFFLESAKNHLTFASSIRTNNICATR